MRKPISWDNLWINIATEVAKRSKDPNTQVGCLIVSPDNRSVHFGYNGFPRKIEDTEERWKRPTKYTLVLHAENNCILNAKENLHGWTCYLTMPPCDKCALLLIQAGISRIVYLNDPSSDAFDYKLSFELLKEANIKVEKYEVL